MSTKSAAHGIALLLSVPMLENCSILFFSISPTSFLVTKFKKSAEQKREKRDNIDIKAENLKKKVLDSL